MSRQTDEPNDQASQGRRKRKLSFGKGGLARLLPYMKPQLRLFILSTVLVVIINAAVLIQPYIIQVIIDNHLKLGDLANSLRPIIWLGLAYFAAIAVNSLTQVMQALVMANLGQNTLMHIRRDVFFHIMHLPMSFLDTYSSGRLITRATNDVETLNELFTDVIINLMRDFLMLAGIVGMMLFLNWRLALIAFITTPLILMVTLLVRTALRKNFITMKSLIGRINGFFAENISGMRVVQIFGREKAKRKEFEELNDEYMDSTLLQIRLNSLLRPIMEIINNLGIAILVAYASRGLIEGSLQIGVLYAFTAYIRQFFEPINDLAEIYSTIQSAVVSSERIFELLSNQTGQEYLHVGDPLPELKGHVEFKNVWFAYNEGEWVLKDVSFTVEPGEFVAFVGATGAGKSTIMHLLCRFYDIDRGRILIDGRDIRDYNRKALRKAIGVVQQDVFVYSGTILDNITLKRPELSAAQAREAARIVNADSFIDRLPKRYDEPVTEGGSTLSAGQRQLLSFARTIASRPSLLILDEATAKIDTETELLIQDAIAKMARDRSMIAVAHRISTIADADKIIVMHQGRVAEEGSRDELLARDGLFRVLYRLQYEEA